MSSFIEGRCRRSQVVFSCKAGFPGCQWEPGHHWYFCVGRRCWSPLEESPTAVCSCSSHIKPNLEWCNFQPPGTQHTNGNSLSAVLVTSATGSPPVVMLLWSSSAIYYTLELFAKLSNFQINERSLDSVVYFILFMVCEFLQDCLII